MQFTDTQTTPNETNTKHRTDQPQQQRNNQYMGKKLQNKKTTKKKNRLPGRTGERPDVSVSTVADMQRRSGTRQATTADEQQDLTPPKDYAQLLLEVFVQIPDGYLGMRDVVARVECGQCSLTQDNDSDGKRRLPPRVLYGTQWSCIGLLGVVMLQAEAIGML